MTRMRCLSLMFLGSVILAGCNGSVGNPSTDVGVTTGDTTATQTQTNEQTQNTDVDVDQNVTVTGQDLPTAVARANPEAGPRGGEVTLDGSESTPGTGGGSLSYIWTLNTDYDGTVSIQDATSVQATLKIPQTIADGAEIVVTLTVTAGGRSDDTNLTVPVEGGDTFVEAPDTGEVPGAGCTDDFECDNEIFCDGPERCSEGVCRRGLPPCPVGVRCDDGLQECVGLLQGQCTSPFDCDDGLFCNGVEDCVNGSCQPGLLPCGQDETCDEGTAQCLPLGGQAGALLEDSCFSAFTVCPGFVYNGSTAPATIDGADFCNGTGPDVWLTYTPVSDGELTVTLCGSLFDTVVSVHTCCDRNGACILNCNDDGGSCGTQSELTVTVFGYVQYLIRISGYSGANGDFEVQLFGPPCAEF